MLQKRYDKTIEEKWQKYWAGNSIYNFDENDTEKEIYSIDTPPPFTSGELHMGHVLSYSFFDFAARYKRMKGYNVYYPQGWDTQGFPTEVRVEKKYGRLPPVQFREKCIEWTRDMIERMKSQMNEMGFSPDWRYEYRTMDPEYHRKVQLSLVRMYNDKLIYMDKYPVYWSPELGSAVAKAELEDMEKDGTIWDIRFTGPEGEDLIIATTRPEMLHACGAVLYHPDDERYSHLQGKTIKTPFGDEVKAIADKEVDKEFGSGLVMVCTFGDKMDVVWMHRHRLPLKQVIDYHGKMINSGEINGLKVEEAKKKIIEILGERVVASKPLKQMIKIHDRSQKPVELLPSLQWFADIKTTGKRIKELAHQIKWVPDFGISYLIDWVEGAEWDWVISRQRVFGTPLPFYVCECGKTAPAEESELPFYPENAKEKKCECGNAMKAETSTCDCWVDSSISPLIIAGWPDEEKMKRFYPASLRPQGVEIVRTWAFYTIYRSGVALTGRAPFETILLNGNVLAPDGKKMSKSIGNIISPAELLKEYPVDAIRQWAAMSGAMAKDRPFSYEDIKYSKSFLTKVWNATKFVEGLGNAEKTGLTMIDRWIIGRLNTTIKDVSRAMDAYEYHKAISRIQSFFWGEFCDYYVEYVKHRVYEEKDPTRNAALYTLNRVILNTMKIIAPIAPHMAEEIHSIYSTESIHKQKWPEAGEEYPEDVEKVAELNIIVSQLRQYKSNNKMAQNAQLEKVTITTPEKIDPELLNELSRISKITEIENNEGELKVTVG
ncbi:valine--tRNA ligase [Candidatus Micrarchaeota archaeon]|nr:valine--tRNA ligase [Candidatus Micrarchaeota archaeon]